MTVAQLKTNHLYILDLLHEVVRIDQADDALHLIVLGEQGAVWSGSLLLQDVLDMDGVGQTGNFDEHHLRLTLLHKVECAYNGVFATAALQRAVFQVFNRDVLLVHQVVAFKDARLGEDYTNFLPGFCLRMLNRAVVFPEPTKPVRQYKGINFSLIR